MLVLVTLICMLVSSLVFLGWFIKFMNRVDNLRKFENESNEQIVGHIVFKKKGRLMETKKRTQPKQRTSERWCPTCKMKIRGRNHIDGPHHKKKSIAK